MYRIIRIASFFFIFFIAQIASAQKTITGNILDDETNKPIAGVNIYVNNTTISNISDQAGNFKISNLPEGTQQLIISYVGYQTTSINYTSSQLPLNINFKLKSKIENLNEVIIRGNTKLSLKDPFYLDEFKRAFLGNSPFTKHCFIKNIDDLILTRNEQTRESFVSAKKPIIVLNKALGYVIEYELDYFKMSLNGRRFYGKAIFRDIDTTGSSEKVIKARRASYFGSIRHFLRSVYDNNFTAEGYELNTIVRRPNPHTKERDILRNRLSSIESHELFSNKESKLFGDSTPKMRKLYMQRDYLPDSISKYLLQSKDIRGINKNGDVVLKSVDTLLSVTYTKPLQGVMKSFVKQFTESIKLAKSVLHVETTEGIILNPKVNNISRGVGMEGFFSLTYGLSTLLPENYEP